MAPKGSIKSGTAMEDHQSASLANITSNGEFVNRNIFPQVRSMHTISYFHNTDYWQILFTEGALDIKYISQSQKWTQPNSKKARLT